MDIVACLPLHVLTAAAHAEGSIASSDLPKQIAVTISSLFFLGVSSLCAQEKLGIHALCKLVHLHLYS